MRIHREGKNILYTATLGLLSVHFIFARWGVLGRGYALFTVTSMLLYAWMIYFFRDPRRRIVLREQCVLAPADGKIVAVQEVYEGEYFQDKRLQVSIFMSPFNVHVNRNPIAGDVKFLKYHPGKYWVAWHPKSSTKNERTTIVIEGVSGTQVLFRQIAGFLARRIKLYLQEGDRVKQGSECGFIRFGSRVDVFLPLDVKVVVNLGDQVKGGVSILAAY